MKMRSQNRHYTKVWKKRCKHKIGDKCNNAKCTICHSGKVMNIPTKKDLIEESKLKTGF